MILKGFFDKFKDITNGEIQQVTVTEVGDNVALDVNVLSGGAGGTSAADSTASNQVLQITEAQSTNTKLDTVSTNLGTNETKLDSIITELVDVNLELVDLVDETVDTNLALTSTNSLLGDNNTKLDSIITEVTDSNTKLDAAIAKLEEVRLEIVASRDVPLHTSTVVAYVASGNGEGEVESIEYYNGATLELTRTFSYDALNRFIGKVDS